MTRYISKKQTNKQTNKRKPKNKNKTKQNKKSKNINKQNERLLQYTHYLRILYTTIMIIDHAGYGKRTFRTWYLNSF